jgi:hypothetical protein
MARLRFVPRAGILVPYPGRGPGDNHHAGRTPRFTGEAPNPKAPDFHTAHLDLAIENKLDDGPIDVLEGTFEANRFVELCRRDGDVHPFDEYTAKKCCVPFVKLERRDEDGEWVPATAKSPTAPQKSADLTEKKAS